MKTLWTLFFCVGLLSCGAAEDADPPIVETGPSHCAPLPELMANTTALIKEGKLPALKELLSERLTEDQLHALIDASLRLVTALSQEELQALLSLTGNETLEPLLPLTIDLLRFISGDPNDPSTFPTPLFEDTIRLLNVCDGETLFTALDALLASDAMPLFLDSLGDVLEMDLVQSLLENDVSNALNRVGFTAIIENILWAFIWPDFSIAEHVVAPLANLNLIDLSQPPLSTMFETLGDLLDPNQPFKPAMADVICCNFYGVPHCADLSASAVPLDRDPVFVWFMYDLFTTDELAFDELLGVTAAVAEDEAIGAALDPLTTVLRHLSDDSDLRRALVSLLTVLLEPDLAQRLLPEIIVMLEAGLLDELVVVVEAMGSGCTAEALSE